MIFSDQNMTQNVMKCAKNMRNYKYFEADLTLLNVVHAWSAGRQGHKNLTAFKGKNLINIKIMRIIIILMIILLREL